MIEFIISGKKEVGKTLFMLQFADYIAAENGFDCVYKSDTGVQLRKISDSGSIMDIYNKGIRKNSLPYSVTMYDKSQKKVYKFTDTYSLRDIIPNNHQQRKHIRETLRTIIESNNIIHLIDHNYINKKCLDTIDNELYNIGRHKSFYMLLLNKTDISNTMIKYPDFQKKIKLSILPISAKYKEGFFHVYQQIKSYCEAPAISR